MIAGAAILICIELFIYVVYEAVRTIRLVKQFRKSINNNLKPIHQ